MDSVLQVDPLWREAVARLDALDGQLRNMKRQLLKVMVYLYLGTDKNLSQRVESNLIADDVLEMEPDVFAWTVKERLEGIRKQVWG